MKRILVPIDFSKMSTFALEAALELCQRHQAELYIFHNLLEQEELKIGSARMEVIKFTGEAGQDHGKILHDWSKRCLKTNIKSHFIVRTGDFIANMKNLCENIEPELTVMSSTGAGGKREYIWGSMTENVVESVDCSTLVIKNEMDSTEFKNIVFASSFNLEEAEVFKHALELIKPQHDSIIHLLSVDTYNYFSQPTKVMLDAMQSFQLLAKPHVTHIHLHKDVNIDAGIRHFSEQVNPDLLMMSNHIKKPIKHLFKGNNAIRLLNHSKYPVLLIDYK
jgi:nucleotide-binding universal stress UspA family protein